MTYLDSPWYYARRKREVEYRMLLRAYYQGWPYSIPPMETQTSETNNLMLWLGYMQPNDIDKQGQEAESPELPPVPPVYLENCVRNKIDTIAGRVWPTGSTVKWGGSLEGDENEVLRKAVLKKLLNFAGDYGSGESGLNEWINALVHDIPQTGDGLPFIKADGIRGEAQVMFVYFPFEAWDMDVDDLGIPKMLRIEYSMKDEAGRESVRRWDVYKDHITRYAGKPFVALPDDGTPPPDPRPLQNTMYGTAIPPSVYAQPEDRDETAFLKALGSWIAVPLRWERLAAEDLRGAPECSFNDLSCTDDINRILTAWKNGAITIGSPPLFIRDLELPVKAGGAEHTISQRQVGPGGVLEVTSSDFDHAGDAFYPNNLPTSLPHSDVLDRIRHAIAAGAPLSNLDPTQIQRFGELSGFARGMLEEVSNQRVADIRDRILNTRIADLLKTGIRILALKGAVEGLTPTVADKVEISFEYNSLTLSPDEQLKVTTACSMLQKMGAPPKEIVNILPFDWLNPDEVVTAMEEQITHQQDMQQQLLAFKAAGPAKTPGTPGNKAKPNGGTGGTDKRGL